MNSAIAYFASQPQFDSIADYVITEAYLPLCNAIGNAKALNTIYNGTSYPLIDQYMQTQETLLNKMQIDSVYYGTKFRIRLDNALAYRMKEDFTTTLSKLNCIKSWSDSADKPLVERWICMVSNEKMMLDGTINEIQLINNTISCLPNELPTTPTDIYADHEWTAPIMPNQDSINAIVDSIFATLPPDSIFEEDSITLDSVYFTLQPNPANTYTTLTLNDTLSNFVITIYSQYGILQKTIEVNDATISVEINVEELTSGLYYVILSKEIPLDFKMLSIVRE